MQLLKLGSKGTDVKKLQELLVKVGENPGPIDGDFGPLTVTAVKAFQAKNNDRGGYPLNVDGQAGDKTWYAISNIQTCVVAHVVPPAVPSAFPIPLMREDMIKRAEFYLTQNVHETPDGSNSGDGVDQFINPFKVILGAQSFPWCACFVHKCATEAGYVIPLKPTDTNLTFAYVPMWVKYMGDLSSSAIIVGATFNKIGNFIPHRGDIIIFASASHIGFVKNNYGDGYLLTVEGNCSNAVRSRRIPLDAKHFDGFIRLP
jgi:hypothetical protein